MKEKYLIAVLFLFVQGCGEGFKDIPFTGEALPPADERVRYGIVSAVSSERDVQWVQLSKFSEVAGSLVRNDTPPEIAQAKVALIDERGTTDAFVYRGFRVGPRPVEADGQNEEEEDEAPAEAMETELGVHALARRLTAGERYTLRVTVDGAVFTGSCRIPSKRAEELTLDAVVYTHSPTASGLGPGDSDEDAHSAQVRFDFSWPDIPGGQDNFYYAEAYLILTYPSSGGGDQKVEKAPLFRPSDFDDASTLSNQSQKGRRMAISFRFESILHVPRGQGPTLDDVLSVFSLRDGERLIWEKSGVEFFVLTTTKTLYNHQKLAESDRPDTGVFLEPIIAPSNIEKKSGNKRVGAQGVFGCYRATRLFVTFDKVRALAREEGAD